MNSVHKMPVQGATIHDPTQDMNHRQQPSTSGLSHLGLSAIEVPAPRDHFANLHRLGGSSKVAWYFLHTALLVVSAVFFLQGHAVLGALGSYSGLLLTVFVGLQLLSIWRRDTLVYHPLMSAGIRVRCMRRSKADLLGHAALASVYAGLALISFIALPLKAEQSAVQASNTALQVVGPEFALDFASDIPFLSPDEVLRRATDLAPVGVSVGESHQPATASSQPEAPDSQHTPAMKRTQESAPYHQHMRPADLRQGEWIRWEEVPANAADWDAQQTPPQLGFQA